ncbi:MAG: hypothetical protein UZ21_OP11001000247 [Microgenomates bacterium OLB22]|nr:MAG: hypothetical protein UZ21_OP11001000247 [Microgenomates bacterium OLB22]
MSLNGTSGQVLGAATFAAGVASLPNTGTNMISQILPIVAMIVGAAVVLTFIVTRILRAIR